MPKNAQDHSPKGWSTRSASSAGRWRAGGLAGWQLRRLLGFDVPAPGPWDSRSMIGRAFVLAGCGLGKWASLRWCARRLTTKE